MRPRTWDIDMIDRHLSEAKYDSLKHWRLEHGASHLAAQRMGVVQYLIQKHGLEYNPNMGRKRNANLSNAKRV